MDLFKNNASEKQVIMSRLDNALESVRIEREFADIRRSMLQAVQNDMPFLPIRDWLRRFKFPFFISSYDSTHIQIIEDGSTEVKQLAEILGYRYTDVNGYALKCNGEKSYSPFIKESWDGEDYSNGLFESIEEAIADAKDSDPDAEEVWIGIKVEPKLRWFSSEEEIIDSMFDNLREECGEFAEDGLNISQEQELELGRMIDKTVEEWIEKNRIKPTCYTVVDCGLHVINGKD